MYSFCKDVNTLVNFFSYTNCCRKIAPIYMSIFFVFCLKCAKSENDVKNAFNKLIFFNI